MNAAMNLITIIFILLTVIKSMAYAIWCIKEKNIFGGCAVIILCAASIILLLYNEMNLYM